MRLLQGGQSRDWDLAAANLIVQEANGNMTALSGIHILQSPGMTHGVLVAAGAIVMQAIVEHFRNRRCPERLDARRESLACRGPR